MAKTALQFLSKCRNVAVLKHTRTWAAVQRLHKSPLRTIFAVSTQILFAAKPAQPSLPLRRHKLPALAGAQSHNCQNDRREGSRQGEVEPHFPAHDKILICCYETRNPFRQGLTRQGQRNKGSLTILSKSLGYSSQMCIVACTSTNEATECRAGKIALRSETGSWLDSSSP